MTGETMKRILLAATLLCAAMPAFGQTPAPPKLFASAAEVQRAMAKAKADHKGDDTNTVEVLATVGPYPVQLEYRTGATAPSVHKVQAELIYVVDGGCTMIMGGTLVNPKAGTGTNLSGTAITGGAPRKLAKGDYILVPPGTPHWVTDVQGGRFVSVTLHMPMTAQ
jgi:mannose-6-phosphate isomerase-like protein (cupin superfamily)